MKYGILGGFIKLAFAKTAFAYMENAIPELDMDSYKKRVLKEYRAIVERTPGIGSMKDNMFVMTMYCGAFAIALYKEADGRLDEEKLKGQICPRRVEEQPYADLKRSAPRGSPGRAGLFHALRRAGEIAA